MKFQNGQQVFKKYISGYVPPKRDRKWANAKIVRDGMDKEQQDRLREIADRMDIVMGCGDSYERLVGMIRTWSWPDVGKALENFASSAGRDSLSLEERKQACMDVVLRAGLEG